jgi:hypothetical protein
VLIICASTSTTLVFIIIFVLVSFVVSVLVYFVFLVFLFVLVLFAISGRFLVSFKFGFGLTVVTGAVVRARAK